MSAWFEDSNQIECSIQHVKQAFENPGEFYVDVVSHMPGMTSVELVEQGSDFVVIRTNEGLMRRSGITVRIEPESVTVELDEDYQAGSKVKARSHFLDEFTASAGGVDHRITISDVEAPGLLGFFYRTFGSSNIGRAFLQSHKASLEESASKS